MPGTLDYANRRPGDEIMKMVFLRVFHKEEQVRNNIKDSEVVFYLKYLPTDSHDGCSGDQYNTAVVKFNDVIDAVVANKDKMWEKYKQLNDPSKFMAALEAHTDAIRACKQTKPYLIYAYGNSAADGALTCRTIKDMIRREKDAGAVSGYVNATRLNKLGGEYVKAEAYTKEQFRGYKMMGGTAKDAGSIVKREDPCKMY